MNYLGGYGGWGMGVGVGGLGDGVGGMGDSAKPQTPNPQSPIPNPHVKKINLIYSLNFIKNDYSKFKLI